MINGSGDTTPKKYYLFYNSPFGKMYAEDVWGERMTWDADRVDAQMQLWSDAWQKEEVP